MKTTPANPTPAVHVSNARAEAAENLRAQVDAEAAKNDAELDKRRLEIEAQQAVQRHVIELYTTKYVG
jgi:hypothetical protein